MLADNHYGMYGFDAPGNFLWTQQGADDIGMPWLAGTVIDEQFIIDNFGYPSAALMCKDVPDYCKAKEQDYLAAPATARFSVLRTGTGDLDLLAGGDRACIRCTASIPPAPRLPPPRPATRTTSRA